MNTVLCSWGIGMWEKSYFQAGKVNPNTVKIGISDIGRLGNLQTSDKFWPLSENFSLNDFLLFNKAAISQ